MKKREFPNWHHIQNKSGNRNEDPWTSPGSETYQRYHHLSQDVTQSVHNIRLCYIKTNHHIKSDVESSTTYSLPVGYPKMDVSGKENIKSRDPSPRSLLRERVRQGSGTTIGEVDVVTRFKRNGVSPETTRRRGERDPHQARLPIQRSSGHWEVTKWSRDTNVLSLTHVTTHTDVHQTTTSPSYHLLGVRLVTTTLTRWSYDGCRTPKVFVTWWVYKELYGTRSRRVKEHVRQGKVTVREGTSSRWRIRSGSLGVYV